MKPTHRIFCPQCHRQKMLFETEQKALRFIAFNKDAFTDVHPTRAYFCTGCGGWHVTHRPRLPRRTSQNDDL